MATINPTNALINKLNSTSSSLTQNSGSNGAGSATGTSSSGSSGLSGIASTSAASLQNNFMTLLITQLQNQDPMNPMDSSQMTSQLAQISTVSGISQLNSTLSALNTSLGNNQSMSAATSLIGHTVLVPGSSVNLTSGSSATLGVQLPQAASNLTVTIKNGAGAVVDTLNLGSQASGVVPVTWNGKSSTGSTLPSGTYSVSASASAGNTAVTATPLTSGTVNSVTMGSQGASLDLGTLGTFALSSVAYIQ